MIYDRYLTVCDLVGTPPASRTLTVNSAHFYAELEVWHRRFFEAQQAGSRIDRMVRVPFGQDISATQYIIPEDGHTYRIVQAQHGLDDDGLPVTTLSLERMEANYDILRTQSGS